MQADLTIGGRERKVIMQANKERVLLRVGSCDRRVHFGRAAS